MTKIYQHKCLQCGKLFQNRYPDSKFCCIPCSEEYHIENIKFYKKDNNCCKLCSGEKDNTNADYCNACQIIVDDFEELKPICYKCGNLIEDFDLTYYQQHGRVCKGCLRKRNAN